MAKSGTEVGDKSLQDSDEYNTTNRIQWAQYNEHNEYNERNEYKIQ